MPTPEVTLLPTQTVESPGAETPPQGAAPSPQGDAPSQETVSTQVEPGDNKPQVTETTRRKPSEFYRERERVRRLEGMLQSQSTRMEEMAVLLKKLQPPEVSVGQGKFDWEEFLNNPENVLTAREKRFMDQIQKLESKVSQWENSQVLAEQTKNEQEALEILFPKVNPEDESTWEERAAGNPEKAEQLIKLMRESGLDKFSQINPKLAAKLALKEFEEQSKSPPTVVRKTVMGGIVRGGPGTGKTQQSTIEEKRTELRRLSEEASNNPELRFDEKHKARREQLIRDIERLAKE